MRLRPYSPPVRRWGVRAGADRSQRLMRRAPGEVERYGYDELVRDPWPRTTYTDSGRRVKPAPGADDQHLSRAIGCTRMPARPGAGGPAPRARGVARAPARPSVALSAVWLGAALRKRLDELAARVGRRTPPAPERPSRPDPYPHVPVHLTADDEARAHGYRSWAALQRAVRLELDEAHLRRSGVRVKDKRKPWHDRVDWVAEAIITRVRAIIRDGRPRA